MIPEKGVRNRPASTEYDSDQILAKASISDVASTPNPNSSVGSIAVRPR